jgi:hypothetical protein
MNGRLQPRVVRRENDSRVLDVMLAEYELIRELRTAHSGNASVQVGQLFVAASVAVAAIAAVASLGGEMTAMRSVAIAGIGATMLGLGLLVFSRFVELSVRRYEYDVYLNAIRTFMIERLPEIRSYVLLPTLQESTRRTAPSVRVARMVTAFDSALVGAGAAAAVWAAAHTAWLAAVAALPAIAASAASHMWYEHRTITRKRRYLSEVLEARGWAAETWKE